MNTIARRNALKETDVQHSAGANEHQSAEQPPEKVRAAGEAPAAKIRVFIAAENRLLRDALAKMLAKQENIQVTGLDAMTPFREEGLRKLEAEVFLFASRGNLDDDLAVIRVVRAVAPQTRILLMGVGSAPGDFLQSVRAGVSGYMLRDASTEEVLRGIRAVQAGGGACSGGLRRVVFLYLEREAAMMPC